MAIIFQQWCRRYGAERALEHAKSLPPVPISGRWGSISASLGRLAPCRHQLSIVMHDVLAGPAPAGEHEAVGLE
eukprot:1240188-Pyramimonas_sp.AAC.1